MSLKKTLFTGTILLALSQLLSRILGVVRDHLFAVTFGTGGLGVMSLDTYYAAFRIPDLLYTLLMYGTVSVAFIPLFTELKTKKTMKESWEFTNSLLNFFLILFIGISGSIILFTEPILQLFVPGFTPEQMEITINLVRIMMISPLFFSVTSIMVAVQNTFHRFTMHAIGPLVYNLGIIGSIVFFGETYGVYGITWGVIVGAFFYMILQIFGAMQCGWKWQPILYLNTRPFREMIRMVLPRILGLSAMQINLVVDTFIASSLAVGSLTVLNLAINLQTLPFGMIAISVAITTFTHFSFLATTKQWNELQKKVENSVKQIWFLLLPASVGMWILSGDLIWILFGGGAFTQGDAMQTQEILGFFLIAIIAHGMIPLISRVFFALKNTWTPVYIALISVGINIILSFQFAPHMGPAGLALANAIAMWINFLLLGLALKKRIGTFISATFCFKLSLAVAVMAAGVSGTHTFLQTAPILLRLILPTFFGIILYWSITKTLKMPEHKLLTHFFQKKEKADT